MWVVLIILILLLSATALSASVKPPASPDGASILTATHPGCSGSSKGKEAKAIKSLRVFLSLLAEGSYSRAYSLIAPRSKRAGDPVAYHAPLSYESFVAELTLYPSTHLAVRRNRKFREYELALSRWESPTRLLIGLNFYAGDRDEAVMVCERGRWFVVNPLHIIR